MNKTATHLPTIMDAKAHRVHDTRPAETHVRN